MELHYHPKHSVDPKRWKEYLFEFIVIFVAITGSFFAENLRENLVEKHDTKEYLEKLILDLKVDSTNISRTIELNISLIRGLDSLTDIMKDPELKNKIPHFFSLNQQYANSHYSFNPIKTTIIQLMNIGGLRLIRNKTVSEGIINYNKSNDDLMRIEEYAGKQLSQNLEKQAELFDFIAAENSDYKNTLIASKSTISNYYFKIRNYKYSLMLTNFQLEKLKNEAILLAKLIEQEYNIR